MKRVFDKSRGQVMVLYAGALAFALAGAVALCTDVGIMYVNWEQLQKAADAAVLAGANYLPSDPATAISTAQSWSVANNSVLASEIVGTPTVNGNDTQLSITLKRTVPYNFGKVLGLVSADVEVTATAQTQNIQGAGGQHLIPIGFPCANPGSSPCVSPGDNIALPGENPGPPGQFKLSPGNWGGLAFNDGQQYTGNHFSDAVANGYQGSAPIMLGTVSGVITTTGNDVNNFAPAGLTKRYKGGTLTFPLPSSMTASDFKDSRIIELPMVAAFPNGKKVIDITGFITAVLIPDGHGAFYAQAVSIALGNQVASTSAPGTGTYTPVLVN